MRTQDSHPHPLLYYVINPLMTSITWGAVIRRDATAPENPIFLIRTMAERSKRTLGPPSYIFMNDSDFVFHLNGQARNRQGLRRQWLRLGQSRYPNGRIGHSWWEMIRKPEESNQHLLIRTRLFNGFAQVNQSKKILGTSVNIRLPFYGSPRTDSPCSAM